MADEDPPGYIWEGDQDEVARAETAVDEEIAAARQADISFLAEAGASEAEVEALVAAGVGRAALLAEGGGDLQDEMLQLHAQLLEDGQEVRVPLLANLVHLGKSKAERAHTRLALQQPEALQLPEQVRGVLTDATIATLLKMLGAAGWTAGGLAEGRLVQQWFRESRKALKPPFGSGPFLERLAQWVERDLSIPASAERARARAPEADEGAGVPPATPTASLTGAMRDVLDKASSRRPLGGEAPRGTVQQMSAAADANLVSPKTMKLNADALSMVETTLAEVVEQDAEANPGRSYYVMAPGGRGVLLHPWGPYHKDRELQGTGVRDSDRPSDSLVVWPPQREVYMSIVDGLCKRKFGRRLYNSDEWAACMRHPAFGVTCKGPVRDPDDHYFSQKTVRVALKLVIVWLQQNFGCKIYIPGHEALTGFAYDCARNVANAQLLALVDNMVGNPDAIINPEARDYFGIEEHCHMRRHFLGSDSPAVKVALAGHGLQLIHGIRQEGLSRGALTNGDVQFLFGEYALKSDPPSAPKRMGLFARVRLSITKFGIRNYTAKTGESIKHPKGEREATWYLVTPTPLGSLMDIPGDLLEYAVAAGKTRQTTVQGVLDSLDPRAKYCPYDCLLDCPGCKDAGTKGSGPTGDQTEVQWYATLGLTADGRRVLCPLHQRVETPEEARDGDFDPIRRAQWKLADFLLRPSRSVSGPVYLTTGFSATELGQFLKQLARESGLPWRFMSGRSCRVAFITDFILQTGKEGAGWRASHEDSGTVLTYAGRHLLGRQALTDRLPGIDQLNQEDLPPIGNSAFFEVLSQEELDLCVLNAEQVNLLHETLPELAGGLEECRRLQSQLEDAMGWEVLPEGWLDLTRQSGSKEHIALAVALESRDRRQANDREMAVLYARCAVERQKRAEAKERALSKQSTGRPLKELLAWLGEQETDPADQLANLAWRVQQAESSTKSAKQRAHATRRANVVTRRHTVIPSECKTGLPAPTLGQSGGGVAKKPPLTKGQRHAGAGRKAGVAVEGPMPGGVGYRGATLLLSCPFEDKDGAPCDRARDMDVSKGIPLEAFTKSFAKHTEKCHRVGGRKELFKAIQSQGWYVCGHCGDQGAIRDMATHHYNWHWHGACEDGSDGEAPAPKMGRPPKAEPTAGPVTLGIGVDFRMTEAAVERYRYHVKGKTALSVEPLAVPVIPTPTTAKGNVSVLEVCCPACEQRMYLKKFCDHQLQCKHPEFGVLPVVMDCPWCADQRQPPNTYRTKHVNKAHSEELAILRAGGQAPAHSYAWHQVLGDGAGGGSGAPEGTAQSSSGRGEAEGGGGGSGSRQAGEQTAPKGGAGSEKAQRGRGAKAKAQRPKARDGGAASSSECSMSEGPSSASEEEAERAGDFETGNESGTGQVGAKRKGGEVLEQGSRAERPTRAAKDAALERLQETDGDLQTDEDDFLPVKRPAYFKMRASKARKLEEQQGRKALGHISNMPSPAKNRRRDKLSLGKAKARSAVGQAGDTAAEREAADLARAIAASLADTGGRGGANSDQEEEEMRAAMAASRGNSIRGGGGRGSQNGRGHKRKAVESKVEVICGTDSDTSDFEP